jgi:hypothetical protein
VGVLVQLSEVLDNGLLVELVMSLLDLELLPVDWVLHFEVDFEFEIFGQPKVILVNAESILVFAQDVQISVLEFIRDLQVASYLNFISGNLFLFPFGKRLWMS